MTTLKRQVLSVTILCIFGIMQLDNVQPAYAQGASLEEIVVTARKREETLMEAPLAITALSGETIGKMNLTTLDELAAVAPGFHYVQQSGGGSGRNDRSNSSLVFRGLFLGFEAQGPNNGGIVFIDGAPQIGAQPPALVDIERVEVLKGPQSAYFGRSVLAGAINFVTRDPNTERFSGRVVASYSSFDTVQGQLSLEGPLSDTLAVRASISYDNKGGHYTNFADPNQELGQQKTTSYTAQLQFQPNDRLTAKLFLNLVENDDGPPAQGALKMVTGDGNCDLGGVTFGYFCGELPGGDSLDPAIISGHYELDEEIGPIVSNETGAFRSALDAGLFDHHGLQREAVNAHLKVNYETDSGYQFTSITAFHTDKDATIVDLNFRDQRNVPNPFFGGIPGVPEFSRWQFVVQGEFEDFSQELRVTSPQDQRLRWTAGANYLKTETPFGQNVFGLTIFGPSFGSALTRSESTTPAVFGGIQYDFTDKLTLSVDARYQRDELKQAVILAADGLPPAPPQDEELSETYNSFSPRVSLDYQYGDNSTIYGLYSVGSRPGGFNAVIQGSSQAIIDQFAVFGATLAYDEEELENYEFGVKSTWMEGRLQTRLAVYYDPYTDGQNAIAFPVALPDGTVNFQTAFVNSAEVDLQGFEFEFDALPMENLSLSGTLGYTDTDIKRFVCVDGANIRGNNDCSGSELPSVSKWTGTLSGEYARPLSGDRDWFARLDYRYQGKYFVDYTNVASVGAQNIVNFRLGLRNEGVRIEGFVTNLFEDDTLPSAFSGVDALTIFSSNEIRFGLARKRTFGIRATYDF